MSKIIVSKEEVKRFLVNYQGLSRSHQYIGNEGIIEYIKKVGCIQFDPLNVVGRNPDLVLQSRIKDYSKKNLEQLLYDDRVLIDGWDKMMSIYHVNDWPCFRRVRQAHAESNISVMQKRGTIDAMNYLTKVKDIINSDGPKLARDIDVGGVKKGRWSSSRYSNVALDHLFHLGELGVLKKKNNQKIFDLIENLIPHHILKINDPFKDDKDFYKWYIERRIGSIGMLWSRNGGAWLGHFISNKEMREKVIAELIDEQSIVSVKIEDIKEEFYIKSEDLKKLNKVDDDNENVVRFLAPLDNLMWDRDLIERIFNFKYSWEVYVPMKKRKYGYYVLPVLYGDNLIARFEPAKQRNDDPLLIKNWWWEEGVEVTPELLNSIKKAFEEFSKYLGTKHGSLDCYNFVLNTCN